MIILFLDFDGVLHPYAPWPHNEHVRSKYFAFLPRLESVLREFPQVHVVVASDWRLHHTLDELRGFFAEDIRERVLGTTAPDMLATDRVGKRQLQAQQYLRDHNLVDVPWIAIDDTPNNYLPDAHLVLCQNMFGPQEEETLRQLIITVLSGEAATPAVS